MSLDKRISSVLGMAARNSWVVPGLLLIGVAGYIWWSTNTNFYDSGRQSLYAAHSQAIGTSNQLGFVVRAGNDSTDDQEQLSYFASKLNRAEKALTGAEHEASKGSGFRSGRELPTEHSESGVDALASARSQLEIQMARVDSGKVPDFEALSETQVILKDAARHFYIEMPKGGTKYWLPLTIGVIGLFGLAAFKDLSRESETL